MKRWRYNKFEINSSFEIRFNFCRKYHELIELFTCFPKIYNMLQIFILEHREPLRNVVTRFSQLHFFLVFWSWRNIFLIHLSMYITDFFFIRKIKHFSINWWDRFLKYISVVQIYENLGKSSKQFLRFSVWNGHYISTKTNFKKLFQQFLDKIFFFILKQSSTFSMPPCVGKMFRAKSPIFMSKLSITHLLSKMVGSIFYQMLVTLAFLFPEIFIGICCAV